MSVALVLEVQALFLLNNSNCLVVCVMSQNQLFQKKHRSLVRNLLPHLDLRGPSMRCVGNLAIIALLVGDHKLHHKCLLQHGVRLYFLLNSDLDFEPARVGLCPDEGCIQKLNAFKAFDVLQADGKQLSALKVCINPGRSKISVALATVVQNITPGYPFSNVNLALQAIDACVCSVWNCHHSTHAASHPLSHQKLRICHCYTTTLLVRLAANICVQASGLISIHCFVECCILSEHLWLI